jgi:hypothetical protein
VRFGEGDGATGIAGGRCDRDRAENPCLRASAKISPTRPSYSGKVQVTVRVDHARERTSGVAGRAAGRVALALAGAHPRRLASV